MALKVVGGLFFIVFRSLRQHVLSTVITIGSVALASGLVMSVFAIKTQTYEAFIGGPVGFDAVLGARGSQLQLVLNTIFHLETSPGNIPWTMYTGMKNNPMVALAIPYAVGDNYRGFRVVGTTEEIFTQFEYTKDRRFTFKEGRAFDPSAREAVIGSYVAEKTGLSAGDTILPYHGIIYDEEQKHEDQYTITGVLDATNSPSDKVVWIPIDGVFHMGGHVLRGAGTPYRPEPDQEIPDEVKEVSAVMLKFNGAQAGFFLNQQINRQGSAATLAWPIGRVMADLFDKIGWVNRILELVAYLVIVVAAGSILASISNTINERRREFAILRALGARRSTVFAAIVLESATIAGFGAGVGYAVYAAILAGASYVVRAQTGVVLDVMKADPILWIAPAGMVGIGVIAGVIPAMKAYATDVASNLTPTS